MTASKRAAPSLAASTCAPYPYGDSRGRAMTATTSSNDDQSVDSDTNGWSGSHQKHQAAKTASVAAANTQSAVYRTTSPYRVPMARPTSRSRVNSMNSRFLMSFIVCAAPTPATALIRHSPRVFLFNTPEYVSPIRGVLLRGAFGVGGNPFFVRVYVPPPSIEQRIPKADPKGSCRPLTYAAYVIQCRTYETNERRPHHGLS